MALVTAAIAGGIYNAIEPATWQDKFLDGLVGASAAIVLVIVLFLLIFLGKLISIPARLYAEKSEKITNLELRKGSSADVNGQILLSELGVYLQGAVSKFATALNWEAGFSAMELEVRDILSAGKLSATGRKTDWTNEITKHHEARSDINKDFWQLPFRRIDWTSLCLDNPFKRATAVNDRGDIEFYDLAFDRVAVHQIWPEDYDEPIGIVDLAALAKLFLGYDFETERCHTVSFIGGIREAASLGRLSLIGRKNLTHYDSRSTDFYPLLPIPKEHFHDWWIDVHLLFNGTENFNITTHQPGSSSGGGGFRDLHCEDRKAALTWLLKFQPKRLEPRRESKAGA